MFKYGNKHHRWAYFQINFPNIGNIYTPPTQTLTWATSKYNSDQVEILGNIGADRKKFYYESCVFKF